jgi:hypothetical protein
MVVSHGTPLSPGLEAPLAFVGWLPLVAGIVAGVIRSSTSPQLELRIFR